MIGMAASDSAFRSQNEAHRRFRNGAKGRLKPAGQARKIFPRSPVVNASLFPAHFRSAAVQATSHYVPAPAASSITT
jgi:hypothetical protein